MKFNPPKAFGDPGQLMITLNFPSRLRLSIVSIIDLSPSVGSQFFAAEV